MPACYARLNPLFSADSDQASNCVNNSSSPSSSSNEPFGIASPKASETHEEPEWVREQALKHGFDEAAALNKQPAEQSAKQTYADLAGRPQRANEPTRPHVNLAVQVPPGKTSMSDAIEAIAQSQAETSTLFSTLSKQLMEFMSVMRANQQAPAAAAVQQAVEQERQRLCGIRAGELHQEAARVEELRGQLAEAQRSQHAAEQRARALLKEQEARREEELNREDHNRVSHPLHCALPTSNTSVTSTHTPLCLTSEHVTDSARAQADSSRVRQKATRSSTSKLTDRGGVFTMRNPS